MRWQARVAVLLAANRRIERVWTISPLLEATRGCGYDGPMVAAATTTGSETIVPIHRLDLDAYNQIVASGALEGQRVELLEGLFVEMSPQSRDHAAVIETLTGHFANADARLRVQLPLEVVPDSEPEPDIALVAPHSPRGEHPRTALLVIEVAVSSQQIDREVKGRLYALAGIPTYWLIDVPVRAVEVYSDPHADGYRRCKRHGAQAILSCPIAGVADLSLVSLFGDQGD